MHDSIDRDNWLVAKAHECLQRPEDFGWFGDDDMFVTWGFAGITHVLNSDDILQESNFEVISRDLIRRFPDDFDIVGVKHWAFGDLDQLRVRVLKNDGKVEYDNLTEAFDALMEWHESLMNYPVADEMHFSELESEREVEQMAFTLKHEFSHLIEVDDFESAAGDILYDINHWSYCSYSEPPTDEEVLKAIFNLRFCSMEESEFWNEWADQNNKEIVWDHLSETGGKFQQIKGQMSIYDVL